MINSRWAKYASDYRRPRYCGVDNVTAAAGVGGATFASDDIAGVHYPRAKVVWGADGVATDVADSAAARLPVKVGEELPAGTQNIGAVTANAGTNLNTSALALDATLTGGTQKAIARGGAKGATVAGDVTSNPVDANTQALHVNLTGTNTVGLVAGAAIIGSLTANQSVNTAQINAVTPLMGNGVTGTGSQRVTIASDNTAFPVNATLTAETVKVIGTINIAAGQTVAAVTAITNALPVGANVIGKVSIDQATPGTTNAVQVIALGAASTANSTAVNLGAGAVFTGTSEDVLEYAMMAVSIFSSHVSATDGLSIQQSSNGTNWDFMDIFTIPAVTGKTFAIPVQARFMRLVYTNGATLTTSLRIQTLFYKAAKGDNPLRPQDARSNEIDIGETLSYSMGYNGATWDRLRSTTANGLAVDVTRLSALVAGAAVIGSLAANQSTNVAQINAVAPLMGNGVTGTGSLRVTIASDNTAFPVNATLSAETVKVIGTINISAAQTIAAVTAITNALPVGANVIGALSANQSVNTAQINGVAVTMGTGISGTGVQRVTLATDIALPTGSNVIGALTANQSINSAQVSGVAITVGNGVSGTGVQRVTLASDSTGLVALQAASLAITATAAANTGLTLTIPAPGVGLFHYITGLKITRNATAALAGTATLVITSTNLPGSWAESVGNAMVAGGTQIDLQMAFGFPFKSSVANTATTIVMPAPGAAVLWRAWVTYYTGP